MNIYERPDAVTGCGFVIEWGGMKQHSVAWPDRPAERFRDEDLQERGIAVRKAAVVPFKDRDKISEPPAKIVEYTPGKRDEAIEKLPAAPAEPLPLEEPPATDQPAEPVAEPAAAPAPPKLRFSTALTEAANIRTALEDNPKLTNREVIDLLHGSGIEVSASQVSRERRALAKLAEQEGDE